MGRLSIQPLSDDRKRQIDEGQVKVLKTQDAAYLLNISRKRLREWVRDKPTLSKIAGGNLSPKGEIFFRYDALVDWTFSVTREDMLINAEVERIK